MHLFNEDFLFSHFAKVCNFEFMPLHLLESPEHKTFLCVGFMVQIILKLWNEMVVTILCFQFLYFHFLLILFLCVVRIFKCAEEWR